MTDNKPKYGEHADKQEQIDAEWSARRARSAGAPPVVLPSTIRPTSSPAQIGGAVIGVLLVATLLVPLGIFLVRWALGVL